MDGILLVDKPKDWTSHDVCAFLKKRFSFKKVGHAGTLDPLATGLLVILLGKATKLSSAFSSSDKEYSGVMELGVGTDSHDKKGQVIKTAPWEHIELDKVRAEAKNFIGNILQIPPMVSALKHKGVRLYKLARDGKTVPRDPREIKVFDLSFSKKEGPMIHFATKVSKGTYVRTLINDLGEALGCYGALRELARVSSGEFHLKSSVTIEIIKKCTREELSKKIIPLGAYAAYENRN